MSSISKKNKILIPFIVITLVFIWGNSILSKDVSAKESSSVMGVITPFLEIFLGKGNVTHYIVRKLAHFAEFSVLGFEFCLLNSYHRAVKHLIFAFFASLFGLLCAFLDESIQMITGRGDQIIDVWIDYSGVVFGVIISFLVYRIILMIKNKRHISE